MILKTFTRVLTTDLEKTLSVFSRMYGAEPYFRAEFKAWRAAAVGDVLVIAGSEEALAPLHGTFGPLIVDDIHEAEKALRNAGAEITLPIEPGPTGVYLYARHPDGSIVEYCQWRQDLIDKWIRQ